MKSSLRNLFWSLFLLPYFFSLVSSIKCYRCSSTNPLKDPYQCNEFFDDSTLQPEPCDDVYGARFCVKQTGRFEGGLGTKRFCTSNDLGNYCNYVEQPGDVRQYRSCYFTCAGDGCNSATRTEMKMLLLTITMFAFYIICYFF